MYPILNDRVKKYLSTYINTDQAFGPPEPKHITDPESSAALFEWNNRAFAVSIKGSDVFVGRRGAGKSSLIKSILERKHLIPEFESEFNTNFLADNKIKKSELVKIPDFVVSFDAPEFIAALEDRYKDRMPLIEELDKLWTNRIWLEIGKEIKRNRTIWDTLGKDIKNYIDKHSGFIFNPNEEDDLEILKPNDFIVKLESFLLSKNLSVIVTLDNHDRFTFERKQVFVVGGMIAATGKYIGTVNKPVNIKICLPAENFRNLKHLTIRPDKDLHRVEYLHWKPLELLRLVARRLRVYLQIYHMDEFLKIKDINVYESKETLKAFWHKYFPERITNAVGIEEDTLAYILRHTHMLPRQVISIFNSISNQMPGYETPFISRKFNESEIIKGIQSTEKINIEAILYMYQDLYPEVHSLFDKIMPRLFRKFKYGHLQHVWRSDGKKTMEKMNKPEFHDFYNLLLSTGAIGLYNNEKSSNIYYTAQFEFNSEHSLSLSDKDFLCVHPMFSRCFNLAKNDENLVVMPIGVKLEEIT